MTKAHYISEWSVVNSLSYTHGKPRHINVISMKIPKYFSLTLKKENIHNNLIFPRKSNTALLHVCGLSSIGLGISLHFIYGLKRCVTVTIIKCMINPIHDQLIQLINSFSSNWFTQLLLCTSAPLVLYCDRFDRGSRQVKREPVDLLMEDYDVSLSQRVGIHNYYTKDHIITCDRCTSGKFYSFVRWIIWWQVTSDEDTWRPLIRYGIYLYMYFMVLLWYFILRNVMEYMKLIILPAFLEGAVFCISKKKENAQRILSNCNLYVTRLMQMTTNKTMKNW